MKISVIGAGSFGTVLAIILAENGNKVNIWARREEIVNEINTQRYSSQYLPKAKIPSNVAASNSLKDAVLDSQLIISAVPSEFTREIMISLRPFFSNQIILSATKGIEQSTGKRMSQVIKEILNTDNIAVLSGPNHAGEMALKMPTASVVASENKKSANTIAKCLTNEYFKIYTINDVSGTEICGAFKNIIAIATGACDGLGLGDNSKSAIMTLGLMEMNNFGKHFGAKRGTVYGLAGVGDLIATCMSKHSRNRFVGENLAKGKSLQEINKMMNGMVAEGIMTTKAVHAYSTSHNIKMPLTKQAYEVLFENKNIKEAMRDLLKII